MKWKPTQKSPRLLPFRTASAGSGRPNLLDKMMTSRPKIATVPPVGKVSAEERDAELSGMTRSLQRRLSGLNLPVGMREAIVQRQVA